MTPRPLVSSQPSASRPLEIDPPRPPRSGAGFAAITLVVFVTGAVGVLAWSMLR